MYKYDGTVTKSENKGCLPYITTQEHGEHYLCIMAEGAYFSFGPLTQTNLIRLIAESADRLLQAPE